MCRGVLYVGDFFLLTGCIEGLRRIPRIYRLHEALLGLLDGLLDRVNDGHQASAAIAKIEFPALPAFKVELPTIALPHMPQFTLPKIELPTIELPKIDLPIVGILKNTAKEAPKAAAQVISELDVEPGAKRKAAKKKDAKK